MLFEEPATKKGGPSKKTQQKRQKYKKAATATLNESQLIMNEQPRAAGTLTPSHEKNIDVPQAAQPKASQFMRPKRRDSGDGESTAMRVTKDNSAWMKSVSGVAPAHSSNSYAEETFDKSRTQKAGSPGKAKNSEKKY